ncbi:ATP-binding protein [Pseudomonas sp.]|uniref:ATP-binding protein n=1 Tax=Pseudomonas sp. TaxID=306 RepID=UPI0028A6334B|nr:ATP-binding protein [Pseudomonas sp.]
MTVFVAGVHGVGKSFLCQKYADNFSVTYESASGLIRKERARADWSADKRARDIDGNQVALRAAVHRIIKAGQPLLLDGHFVLINDKSEFVELDASVFQDIGITGVVILEADAKTIVSRLAARDFEKSAVDINLFLERERAQARFVCHELSIPIKILTQPDLSEFSNVVSNFFKISV